MIVGDDGNQETITTIFNFHEGGPEFSINSRSSLSVVETAGFDVSNLVFQIDNEKKFSISFEKYKLHNFLYVKDSTAFISKKLLAGIYKDSLGYRYIFNDTGEAIFPNSKFNYTIGLDHIEIRSDYFIDNTNNITWGFIRRTSRLDIYPTEGNDVKTISNEPRYSLILEQ